MLTIEQLKERAIQLFPQSEIMQAQWIKQTNLLYQTGKHRLAYSVKGAIPNEKN